MKNLFFLLCGLLAMQTISAQTHDHVLGFGYSTNVTAVCALSDGRFMAAGTGVPAPGALFVDTVFAVVYNASGQILHRKYVPAPASEVRRVTNAEALPNGGFVISTNSTLCDVVSDNVSLFSYDADCNLRWSKTGFSSFDGGPLAVSPDGEVVAVLNNKLMAFDAVTGESLWEFALSGSGLINDLAFVPGTEDFVAVGAPALQYWKHLGAPGSHTYAMTYAASLPAFSYNTKVLVKAGYAYTLDLSQHRLVQFDDTGFNILNTFSWGANDFALFGDGFILGGSSNTSYQLIKADANGAVLESLESDDLWKMGGVLATNGDYITIAGLYGSGPESNPLAPQFQAAHAWLRTLNSFSVPTSSGQSGASLSAVQQLAPVHVDETVFPGVAQSFYKLSGGDFQVQVTNTGSNVLDRVDVLIEFNYNVFWDICFLRPARRLHYEGLGLAPGQSVWLPFGDIEADGQTSVPTEFCFWTAAPNEQPDAHHEDDYYCHTITLGSGEPQVAALKIAPNPADSRGFRVQLSQEAGQHLDYMLLDALGRPVVQGQLEKGSQETWIETQGLSTGLYIFQIGNWRSKVVVNR
ncbi:MAG: T9SS type A sorting domain-containing protein [Saprospiraceae bacterium]